MVFQITLFAKLVFILVLSGINAFLYFNILGIYVVISVIVSGIIIVMSSGTNYEISDGMLRKRFFAIIRNEINIDDIQTIEIYNELKAGQIRINIASPDEDEYRLIFKSGEVMKIPSYYMNKRTSVGKYLAKKYKIKTKDTKKVKYLYG